MVAGFAKCLFMYSLSVMLIIFPLPLLLVFVGIVVVVVACGGGVIFVSVFVVVVIIVDICFPFISMILCCCFVLAEFSSLKAAASPTKNCPKRKNYLEGRKKKFQEQINNRNKQTIQQDCEGK